MPELKPLLALAILAVACGACGSAGSSALSRQDRALVAVDLAHTRQAGSGPRYQPPPASAGVSRGTRMGAWRCRARRGTTYAVHVELFARSHEIVVPAGIGVRDPILNGPFLAGGRCAYPLRTTDPTGVVRIGLPRGRPIPRLGDLFRLWGQSLGRGRLGAFGGAVRVFVDGSRWAADPRTVPLRRHAQIVVEVGDYVAPHSSYGFPPGL